MISDLPEPEAFAELLKKYTPESALVELRDSWELNPDGFSSQDITDLFLELQKGAQGLPLLPCYMPDYDDQKQYDDILL